MTEIICVNTITVPGKGVYIHRDDVARLIADFGSTEATDVRDRCDELSRNILNQIKEKQKC